MIGYPAKVKLIAITDEKDKYGISHKTETAREVFCKAQTCSGAEIAQASQCGIQASIRLVLYRHEYGGEKLVEYGGTRYSVYRHYASPRDMDHVELYLEERAGS